MYDSTPLSKIPCLLDLADLSQQTEEVRNRSDDELKRVYENIFRKMQLCIGIESVRIQTIFFILKLLYFRKYLYFVNNFVLHGLLNYFYKL